MCLPIIQRWCTDRRCTPIPRSTTRHPGTMRRGWRSPLASASPWVRSGVAAAGAGDVAGVETMTSPSTATTISTAIRTSTAAIVSMVGIVRLSFLLAGARAELVGLEVLVEPVALVVSAELEALEVSVELVATGGSTTLHTAGALRIGIVLRRIDLAGQLAETPL